MKNPTQQLELLKKKVSRARKALLSFSAPVRSQNLVSEINPEHEDSFDDHVNNLTFFKELVEITIVKPLEKHDSQTADIVLMLNEIDNKIPKEHSLSSERREHWIAATSEWFGTMSHSDKNSFIARFSKEIDKILDAIDKLIQSVKN